VVGAALLFLPYPNLGLIVVDEAHEPSFKQEEGVQYHARDVAVMRGHFEEIPVILASATPAIETRHMVEIGRYRELKLTERHGLAELPEIQAINLTQDPPLRGRWLAPSLVAELEANSPRASSRSVPQPPRLRPLTLCRHCGHRFQCPNCTAWMVEHRLMHRLAATIAASMPPPKACPECGEEDSLVACGRASSGSLTRSPNCSRASNRGRHQRHHLVPGPRRRIRPCDGAGEIDIVVGTSW
jgi:primosomal protein N' (replication factor Y)